MTTETLEDPDDDGEPDPDTLKRLRYEKRRQQAAKISLENSRVGRDIGSLPPVENPKRRAKAEKSLRVFLETYFAEVFYDRWSDDQKHLIEETQRAITKGLRKAVCLPRGSGKTVIFERALIWGHLCGHCTYSMIVAATKEMATENLGEIKKALEENDLLLADFPEVCYPIRRLGNSPGKARGQTLGGVHTKIRFTATKITLPIVAGSKASGTVISAKALTGGGLRGSKHTLPDGRVVRPGHLLLDDPQTRESAASPSQTRTRERIITADILGMAGPGESLSVLGALTVIYRGDLADRLVDRKLHPAWQGDKRKMLYSWPERMDLWEEYGKLWREEQAECGTSSRATAFYKKNRKAMDAGAVVAWAARKKDHQLSGIEHALALWVESREVFAAEYQNEPLDNDCPDGEELLTAAEIVRKTSGIDRGVVPLDADHLVGFIDVQGSLLYWVVAAFTRGFRGYVVDYGTWPDQPLSYFKLSEAKHTLQARFPNATKEGAIAKGLAELIDKLCSREFEREGGDTTQLDRLLIDEGYLRKVIHEVCRRNPHRRLLVMAKGLGITAGRKPMDEYRPEDGVRAGDHWRLSRDNGVLAVLSDINHWKSFSATRLAAADGDPSSLTLFGHEADCKQHEMIADHLTSEFRVVTWGQGRRVEEWKLRPGRPDNHWLDGVVGCCVGASLLGCSLPDASDGRPRRRLRGRGPSLTAQPAAPPGEGSVVVPAPQEAPQQRRPKRWRPGPSVLRDRGW